MGHPDRFAKLTFAEETERVTRGAVAWRDPPEIGLVKIHGDGLLIVRDPVVVHSLAMPWPASSNHDEVFIEIKMAGDHLDFVALQRAFLRRQACQVQRVEDPKDGFASEEPLWIIASHLPGWLNDMRTVRSICDGCYAIEPSPFALLWIAANELPLVDELVPFLVARSGLSTSLHGGSPIADLCPG